jgi:hypothetical protein
MGPEESPETYTVEELRRKLEVERSRGFLVLAVRRLGSRNGCGDLETTPPRSRAGTTPITGNSGANFRETR